MKKSSKNANKQEMQKDDLLFEALGKNKKRKRRKVIITIVAILLILAIVAVIGVSYLRKKVQEEFAASAGEVQSYEVSTGTISTVVSGSGTLSDVDLEYITVPEGVEIIDVTVEANDTVNEGDVIATVNMASVKGALADVQADIESLDEQISEAESDAADETVYAGVSGRVKMIYAEEGADVADVMYTNGALAIISLDGYMAVDIETDTLDVGDEVTVILSDSEEISGTVSSDVDGTATVLVTDNGPEFDEEVSVYTADGIQVGSGKLYVHNPLRVTGYIGTVGNVRVDLNEKVYDTTKLFTLENTEYSANYNTLLRERAEKEETLMELLVIQRDGAVLAPVSGSVYSVDYTEDGTDIVTLSLDENMSVTINVDEADILSLEIGQSVSVSVSSVSEDVFEGTLTEINRTSSSSGTYSAVVTVNKAQGMLSGMTASVSVRIEGVDNAILIPVEALHKTSDGAYVYTSYNEETQEYGGKVDVVTGLENSTYVEIKSGLSVGDTVYYTENETFGNIFGNIGGFGSIGMPGGEMPEGGDFSGDFSGGEMPDFSGGGMPSGFGGGEMPDFGGGGMPGGFGGN